VITEAREAIRLKQVFGEPYERDGIAVIPAAAVSGGGGGGGDANEAGGAGFGLSARPVGAFRVILVGQVVAIVALLSFRAVVKSIAARRR
jgi:uncharacterized spore protein YtfJ